MNELSFMDKLLDGVEVEWLPLVQVAKIKHGKDWKSLNPGDIPVYGSGGIMGYVDEYAYDKPTVLIPRKGSITNIFYVETPFWNVDTIYYTEINIEKMVPKYLYHFIKTVDLMTLDTGSGRPSLTQAILNQIQIPIPCPDNPEKSLQIQAEIVRILDAFTAMTTELTTELSGDFQPSCPNNCV
ncbi:restriction endonuclease subunit S [Vreelandella zhaodongensis]|uniref:restriction endonuclease subunit S n=1 Tax=Vreelandella zhaodongensis TaxID=1176240 RepID=UPI003EC11EDE